MAVQPKAETPQRLGLALSGGGFRAAFFHIGVLGRMAELGILRTRRGDLDRLGRIDHRRALLPPRSRTCCRRSRTRRSPISALPRQVVARIEQDVPSRASRRHLRGRTLREPPGRTSACAWTNYSRSDRLGELYDDDRSIARPGTRAVLRQRARPRARSTARSRCASCWSRRRARRPASTRSTRITARKAPVPMLVVNATVTEHRPQLALRGRRDGRARSSGDRCARGGRGD